jgi:hypothetical protein
MSKHFVIPVFILISICFIHAQNSKPSFGCYDGIATVIIPSSGQVDIFAVDLISFNHNTHSIVSWSKAANDVYRTFTCRDIVNGRHVDIATRIYVWTPGQSPDSCNVNLFLQDNANNTCKDSALQVIHGQVRDRMGTPMKGITISLRKNGIDFMKAITDEYGDYSFGHINLDSLIGSQGPFIPVSSAGNQQYTLQAEDSYDDYINSISTIDLIILQKEILGIDPFHNNLNFLAADMDRSGTIDILDLINLRKLILGITDGFPGNSSYIFMPSASVSAYKPGTLPPFIISIQGDQSAYDFLGIKIGDIRN